MPPWLCLISHVAGAPLMNARMIDLPDLVFVIAGAIGVIGGAAGAYYAFTARTRRAPQEHGLLPRFEAFIGAVLDGLTVIVAPGCRLAMYDDFLVVRAPAVEIVLAYREMMSVQLHERLMAGVVIRTSDACAFREIVLLSGNLNGRVAALIEERCGLSAT